MEKSLRHLFAIYSLLALAFTSCGPGGQFAGENAAGPASPLAITSTRLPSGTVGQLYSARLSAKGGTLPYTWSVFSGQLPEGLSLDPKTGAITGTPVHVEEVAFTACVRDSSLLEEKSALATLTSTVVPPPLIILTESFPATWPGDNYGVHLAASGGTPPYSWSIVEGSLPPGLDLDPASGRISGIPASLGEFSFTVEVEDSATPPGELIARFGGSPTAP